MNAASVPSFVQEQELNRLMEAYGDGVTRMCLVYLKDWNLAQDAAQETFLKAYRHFASFPGNSSEKTWLMRIAINTCKDMKRNAWFRMVDRRVSLDSIPSPASPYTDRDDSLTRLVMRLPHKSKEVILLYYYQEMKIAQAAKVLCIPEATVSTRLKRAKDRLRKMLEGDGFDEE